MRTLLTALIAVFTLSTASYAQNASGKVSGKVIDGNTRTIESATITLLRTKDSSVAKISVANKEGSFLFEDVAEGKYLVAISAIGHSGGYSESFEISTTNTSVTLKTIELIPVSKELANVSVTARKPLVEQKIDRMLVNVEAAVTNVGSSALDVLEKSPGISVDKDGNISLKGKQGIVVLIDGRESQLGGTDLANYLRGLNANQLEQIEIMTNPPAKFDASGTSGVINIKTKKNRQVGYNGSLSLGYGQGRYPKTNEGLNLNYRNKKVNLFTNLSHNYNQGFGVLEIERNFRDKSTKELVSNFDQVARMQNESQNYGAKIGLDYFASKKTTFGVVFNGFMSDRVFVNRNITDISDAFGDPSSQTRAFSGNDQVWKNFSTNLNFRRMLDTANSELTADVDFVIYNSKNDQTLINSYFDASGNSTFKADTLLGALPQDIRIYSGKIDYLKYLGKDIRFEAGIKSSLVKTDNDAAYDSILNNQLVHDFNRSNHFIYEENINAAYINFSRPLSKKWNAQAGLRLENTNAKGDQVTTGEKFDRHYTQLFPTVYLQYKADNKNSFVLNYGKRIRRPDYQRLNPFINFLDRYTYQQGNPNLRPQFSHNIELSHSFNGMVTTTFNYTNTTDIIQQVIEQNEDRNETYIKAANIAKQRQYGISVNTTVPVTKWWRSNVFVNAFNNKFDGMVNDTMISVKATTLQLNGSQQFNFAKTWSAEISGFYRTGGIEGVIEGKSMGMLSAGISKEIFQKKATIRLNVRDIFYTQGFRGVSKYSNIDARFSETRDSRVVNLGFTYRFSKGKINGAPKRRASSSSDEQSRIGTGNQ
ncbi:MAG TPA: TonB-dependent receptor [Chitinophagaceae bacterium]|nr:TonB-dependent receptor [Chitinophagaceae bacterium]